VLDLGCAYGDLAKYKPAGVSVYGLDVNMVALADANQYEHVLHCDLDQAVLPL